MAKQNSLREKLEEIRVNRNLAHSALAKKIGITWKTYETFRNGDGLTRQATEQKIRSFTERPDGAKSVKGAAPKAKRQQKGGTVSKEDFEFVVKVMAITGQNQLSFDQVQQLVALKK